MTIEISPELEQHVREQIEAGRFASLAEVLEAGVARLRDDKWSEVELVDEDLKAIEEAEREIVAGDVLDWKQVSAEFRREFLAG